MAGTINVGQYSAAMSQMAALSQQTAVIGMNTSLQSAQMAYSTAVMEAQGVQAQLQMNQIATAANIQADIANLAMRNTMGLANKGMEMSLFIAQYREKTLNLFLQIQDGRDANTWGRIKRYAQGFKF